MIRANTLLALCLLASLGIWGCTQGPSANRSGNAEQIKSLEGRIAKLEEDFKAAASARDQFRQKLAATEEQRNQVQKERDDLKKQIAIRTNERDMVQAQRETLQTQYDQFRKNIKDLVGQAEAASLGAPQPITAAAEASSAGKSS